MASNRNRSSSKLQKLKTNNSESWMTRSDAKLYLDRIQPDDSILIEVARRGSIHQLTKEQEEEEINSIPLPTIILDLPAPILDSGPLPQKETFESKFFPDLPFDETLEKLENLLEDTKDFAIDLESKLQELIKKNEDITPQMQTELNQTETKIQNIINEIKSIKEQWNVEDEIILVGANRPQPNSNKPPPIVFPPASLSGNENSPQSSFFLSASALDSIPPPNISNTQSNNNNNNNDNNNNDFQDQYPSQKESVDLILNIPEPLPPSPSQSPSSKLIQLNSSESIPAPLTFNNRNISLIKDEFVESIRSDSVVSSKEEFSYRSNSVTSDNDENNYGNQDESILSIGIENKLGIVVSGEPLPDLPTDGDDWPHWARSNYLRSSKSSFKEGPEAWSSKPLPDKSLHLHLSPEKKNRAEIIYQKIKAYAGEKKTKENDLDIASFIIREGLDSRGLRDEIFAQLLKHTFNNNPSLVSRVKGWELLIFCVSIFLPFNENLLKVLATRIDILSRDPSQDLTTRQELTFLMNRLQRTLQNGDREYPPSTQELTSIKERTPMRLKVTLFQSNAKNLLIDSATTVEEVISVLIKKLQLQKFEGFNLYETYGYIFRQLSPKMKCADVLAKAESLKLANETSQNKYVLTIQIRKSTWNGFQNSWPDPKQKDVVFRQVCTDIGSGRYPTTIFDLLNLAGMALTFNFGKEFANPKDYYPLVNNYISPHWFNVFDIDTWIQLLSIYHKIYSNESQSKIENLQSDYLTLAQSGILFGASIFPNIYAKSSNIKSMLPQFDLALNREGIHFLNNQWEIFHSVSFEEVKSVAVHHAGELLLLETFNSETIEICCFHYILSICEEFSNQLEAFRKYSKFAKSVVAVAEKDEFLGFPADAIIEIIDAPDPNFPLWFSGRYEEKFGMVSVQSVQFLTKDRWKRIAPINIPTVNQKLPVDLNQFSKTALGKERVPRTFQIPEKWSGIIHSQFVPLPLFDFANQVVPTFSQLTGLGISVTDYGSFNASFESFNILKSSSTFKTKLNNKLEEEKKELTPAETRIRAIKELVDTERDFIVDMRLLADYYQKPMIVNHTKLIGTEDDAKKIFSNLSELLIWSKLFSQELESASKDHSGVRVAQLFIDHFETIKANYSTFCTSHNIFVTEVHEKLKSNPTFVQWEEEQKSKIQDPRKKLSMSDFLIKPVQRITKYSLMLETIAKYIPSSNKEDLQIVNDGITCISSLVLFINERAKEIDTEYKLSKLILLMEGSDIVPKIVGKLLIFQLSCKSSPKLTSPDVKIVLFEHLLLILKIKSKEKLTPISTINFGDLMLVDLADNAEKKEINRFEIRDKSLFLSKSVKEKEKEKGSTILYAGSLMEKRKLWEAFSQTQKIYYSKKYKKEITPLPKEHSVTRLRNQEKSTKILEKESLVAARTLSGKSLKERYNSLNSPPEFDENNSSNEKINNQNLVKTLRASGITDSNEVQNRLSKKLSSPTASTPTGSPVSKRQSKNFNLSKNTLRMEGVHSFDDLFTALQWTPKPIRSPILDLPPILQAKSRQAFKNVMVYMGDLPSKSKTQQFKAFQEFIELGIANESLQNELLVQITMQLKNNPHREHEIKGWQMLYSALQSFQPTTKHVIKILTDLFKAYEGVQLTRMILLCQQLFEVQSKSPIFRKKFPSEQEITWLQGDDPAIKAQVTFLDGTTKTFFITCIDSAETLRDQIWEKLGGQTPKYDWGLFERSVQLNTTRAIADNELLCDYFTLWEEALSKKKPEEFCFLFKRRFISNDLKEERLLISSQPVFFNLIFTQLLEQVVSGYLPITLTQSYTLLPCFLYVKYGPRNISDLDKKKIEKFFPTYLPKTNPSCKLSNWVKTIDSEWSRIVFTQDDARQKIIKILQSNPFLGCYIVSVSYKSSKKWLVLSKQGLLVGEPRSTKPDKTIRYHDIINTFGSKDQLKIEYGNMTSPSSITLQGTNLGGADSLINLFRTLYL